jgi:hypothetical protein
MFVADAAQSPPLSTLSETRRPMLPAAASGAGAVFDA